MSTETDTAPATPPDFPLHTDALTRFGRAAYRLLSGEPGAHSYYLRSAGWEECDTYLLWVRPTSCVACRKAGYQCRREQVGPLPFGEAVAAQLAEDARDLSFMVRT